MPPHNGRMNTDNPNKLYIGTSVQFECYSGFTLYGSQTRTCQPDKTWNGTLAVCDDGRKYSSLCLPITFLCLAIFYY